MKEAFSKLISGVVQRLLANILSKFDSGKFCLHIKEQDSLGRIDVRTVYPYTVSLVEGDKDGKFTIKFDKVEVESCQEK